MDNSYFPSDLYSFNLDNRTLQALYVKHERLIYSIARKFTLNPYLLKDLCQVGFLGLKKAVERYDSSKDTKISTFAFPYIRWEMLNFLKENFPQTNHKNEKSILTVESPAENVEKEEIEKITQLAIADLTQTQANIVRKYFYDENTITQIANELNVSKAFVSKTIKISLKKLKIILQQQLN